LLSPKENLSVCFSILLEERIRERLTAQKIIIKIDKMVKEWQDKICTYEMKQKSE
jgi:hypothetical protein